jgi:hypothetical protein
LKGAPPQEARPWHRSLDLAGVLLLLGLLAALALGAPSLTRYLRRPVAAEAGSEAPAPGPEPTPVRQRISVKLFFEEKDARGLAIEDREVALALDLAAQVQAVVGELVKGPATEAHLATLDPETKVLGVFVSKKGVAYVDLSGEVRKVPVAGTEGELLSVYSVVNTITANFPAIERVQVLIDDRVAGTLAGHLDLGRPLRADMTLLAASPLTPLDPGGAPDTVSTPATAPVAPAAPVAVAP